MLCVFGNKLHGKAADYDEDDELLLSSPAKRAKASSSEEENEEEAYTQLEALSRSLPNRMRAYVVEHAFGGGTNGISYVEARNNSYLHDDGVHVFFCGEIAGESSEDVAARIMRVYKGLHDSCLSEMSEMDLACSGLGRLKGQYVFIIYDLHSARIVAARDPMGDEPLFWGTSLFGGKLMFSTDRRLVEEECVDADFFPAGAFFISNKADVNGSIGSFRPDKSELSESDTSQGDVGCNNTRDLISLIPKVPSQNVIATK